MAVDRALVNAQVELQATFYVDGIGTEPAPEAATVTITRGDGTVLVNAAVATPSPDPELPGLFSYTLTPAQNNRLDKLKATWTSGLGTIVTNIEIVGGFLVTAAELIAMYPNDTNAQRMSRRTDIEQRLEDACGWAFVPRYERETITVNRGRARGFGLYYGNLMSGRARLKWGAIRNIRSVITSQGTITYSPSQIALLDVDPVMGILSGLPQSRFHGDTVVEYEHGFDYPTETCHQAAISALSETFGPDRIDGRVVQKQVDRVAVQYASPTQRTAGIEFVTPSVVAFIEGNQRPLVA